MTTPNSAMSTGPSLLIASDQAHIAASLSQMLESWRYQVLAVSSGAEALRSLECSTPPGVALLDMALTDPSPAEILARLASRPEPRRTWTILMREEFPGSDLRSALDAGCDDFLPLPADAVGLRLRIRVAERMR